jgi:hypothetical protein
MKSFLLNARYINKCVQFEEELIIPIYLDLEKFWMGKKLKNITVI